LATTNQAVGELRHVGLEASTVARFALDGCPLQPDSAVIVDELSQLPTVEADLILSALAACEEGQLWLVGDPVQTQPVRAGGLASLIASLAEEGRIPSATLTVNRRQVDPAEREALSRFRDGEVSTSQQLREQAGLEHQPGSPEAARAAMADAVVEAIGRHGDREVAALAVTHADCEDVADLIRSRLIERDIISGPALRGPGWAASRLYQAGDRILLHAHLDLPDGRRLTNGTVATVTDVNASGLTVRPDSSSQQAVIPQAFVSARRPDGCPQLSHAWCRTIDGVQGGTWTEVHLLGTAALDRYRGYVGQSRATAGTHTWNTRAVDPGDHGGRLARGAATPAEEVLGALQRAESKTFAAFDDPYRIADLLERERAAHHVVLARRPVEDSTRLAEARDAVTAAERDLVQSQERVAYWQAECDATSGIGRVRPGVRRRHDQAQSNAQAANRHVHDDAQRLERRRKKVVDLEQHEQAGQAFDRTEGWRQPHITKLDNQLRDHWTDVVLAAARLGEPFAYGKPLLRQVHQTLVDRTRLNPQDPIAERNLIDLERAVLAEPAASTVKRPAQTAHRQPMVAQPGIWPTAGYPYHEHVDGPSLGIDR
jgi:hypothetical protein